MINNVFRWSPDSQNTSRQESLGQTRRISTVSFFKLLAQNGLIYLQDGRKDNCWVMKILQLRTYDGFLSSISMRIMTRKYPFPKPGRLNTWTELSGFRQHALLNLVRMHYVRGEYVAARKVNVVLCILFSVVDFLYSCCQKPSPLRVRAMIGQRFITVRG